MALNAFKIAMLVGSQNINSPGQNYKIENAEVSLKETVI